ncbi:MAG: tetratricopeptide repeat protein [Syntrophotaleaceae bacterium]
MVRIFFATHALCFVIFFSALGTDAIAAVSDQAQRHFDRGTAAVEMAVSESDFEVAAGEFEEAIRLAPDWPEAHYNLGLVREKLNDLDGAIYSFRRYLALAPQAGDAAAVRSQINKVEFRREKLAKEAQVPTLLDGTWRGFMSFCGGSRSELRFYHWGGGEVSVELPVNWNADPGVATDPKRVAVETEGRQVRFSFRSKSVVPGIGTYYCDIEYDLSLVEPGILKGVIKQKDAPGREVILKKR